MNLGRDILLIGLIFVVLGIFISVFRWDSLPRLPGDIYIKKGNFTFYFPWVTSILISIVFSIIMYFFFRK